MTHLALRTWRRLETSSAADLGWAMSSVLRYGSSAGSNLAPTMKNVELSMEIMWKLIEINGNNVVCFNGNDGLQLGKRPNYLQFLSENAGFTSNFTANSMEKMRK